MTNRRVHTKGIPAREALDKAMTEAELQDAVIDFAHLRGWLIHHDRGDYRRTIQGDPGFPDLVLARRGEVLFVELKSEKGKATRDQDAWDRALPILPYHLWKPSDWSSGLIQRELS